MVSNDMLKANLKEKTADTKNRPKLLANMLAAT